MMDDKAVISEALATRECQRAIEERDFGSVLKIVRTSLGWTQGVLGRRVGASQATVSRLEHNTGRIRDLQTLGKLATVLGIPRSIFGLIDDESSNVATVNRGDFIRGMAAIAAGMALPRQIMSDHPGSIGIDTVRDCWSALGKLYELDDECGGSAVCSLAAEMAERLTNALGRASYTSATERRLRAVTAATTVHAGWQAFDAGNQAGARNWWLETLHLSDLGAGAEESRITALSMLAMQANSASGKPREATQILQAARRSAGRSASPTLLSLLAAREAVAQSKLGDRESARKLVSTARNYLDQGRNGDEPEWLSFWGIADLASHESLIGVCLKDSRLAESSARRAVNESDPKRFSRNFSYYRVALSGVLTRVGKLDEAISVTKDCVNSRSVVSSARIDRDLRLNLAMLGSRPHSGARDFARSMQQVVGGGSAR